MHADNSPFSDDLQTAMVVHLQRLQLADSEVVQTRGHLPNIIDICLNDKCICAVKHYFLLLERILTHVEVY